MSVAEMRPTFRFAIGETRGNGLRRLEQLVADEPELYFGHFTDMHAMLTVAERRRHFWTPWLHVELSSTGAGAELFCRFSPHPTIWSAIMLAYLVIAVLSFFSVILGASQQMIDSNPWGYWLLAIWALLAALVWCSSKLGQRLADDEMRELRSLVEKLAAVDV